jgi:hypothetical protein
VLRKHFCLRSAKLRSTDSVNPRAVLSRARPRNRLYSRHRDIGNISPVPIPVTVVITDLVIRKNWVPTKKKEKEQGARSCESVAPNCRLE